MQGFERPEPGLWDVSALVGHLLPEGGMFAFLSRHRGEVFPDADYADLFAPPGTGRPSVPATRMAAVMTLQVLHDYSDRETADALRYDLRWKMAAGLPLEDCGIDPSTLVYWRRRLARSERPHRINDAVKSVIEGTGIVRGRRRRVADSTILADAVATQDTVTQLIAAIRRAAHQVPGAAEVIAGQCTGFDYSRGRRPVIDWSDPQAAGELVSGLVNDANQIVAALAGAPLEDDQAAVVALLGLLAGQDVEPAEGSDGTDGRWKIAAKVAPDRMISQVDPEARHARKNRHTRTDGYRAHLAAEPATGIITDEELTQAAGDGNSDADAAARFVAREHAAVPGNAGPDDDQRTRWYGDTAYGTGELRQAISDAGDEAVIKPKPLRSATEGGFTTDDFTIDHQAGTATCPAGVTRRIPPGRMVTFGAACRDCPLSSQCTTSKAGKSLQVHPYDQALRTARRDWASDPALRQDYRSTRPNVERAIARIATTRGRRVKLRYRGTAKNHAWLKRRTAAANLATLLRHGLTRHHSTWTLAPATT